MGIIIREGRRVEKEHVRHFNVILLLNSITEMRGGVVGEGLQERPANVRVVFRLCVGGRCGIIYQYCISLYYSIV